MAERLFLVRVIPVIVGFVVVKQLPAADAVGVIAVIATLAERRVTVPGIIVGPDPFSTDMTGHGFLCKTARAKELPVELFPLGDGVFTSANRADIGFFFHNSFLLHHLIDDRTQDGSGGSQDDPQDISPGVGLHPRVQTLRSSWSTSSTRMARITESSVFSMVFLLFPFKMKKRLLNAKGIQQSPPLYKNDISLKGTGKSKQGAIRETGG